MKRGGKAGLLLNGTLRIDVRSDDDWSSVSSAALLKELGAWQRLLFGASSYEPELLVANAERREMVVRVPRPGIDQLRAASVLVSRVRDVDVRLTLVSATRHVPSSRPPP